VYFLIHHCRASSSIVVVNHAGRRLPHHASNRCVALVLVLVAPTHERADRGLVQRHLPHVADAEPQAVERERVCAVRGRGRLRRHVRVSPGKVGQERIAGAHPACRQRRPGSGYTSYALLRNVERLAEGAVHLDLGVRARVRAVTERCLVHKQRRTRAGGYELRAGARVARVDEPPAGRVRQHDAVAAAPVRDIDRREACEPERGAQLTMLAPGTARSLSADAAPRRRR
jgi:hypothetical protein